MSMWTDDKELFGLMKEKLYTPVVGDILDTMGYNHQFLPPEIMPLKDDMKLAGRACTILEHNVYEAQKKPFGLLTEALDQLKEDEIYIATGAGNSALWGELLTATARTRGLWEQFLTDIHVTLRRSLHRISRYLQGDAGHRTLRSERMWWISAARSRSDRLRSTMATLCSETWTVC